MPDWLSLWHAVEDPHYAYSFLTWDGNGNVTFRNEAIDNAWAAWYRYKSLGWTDSAVAAVVGMQCYECGLNPWRWQNNDTLSHGNYNGRYVENTHGYGLPQFTPEAVYSDPVGSGQPQAIINFFNTNQDFRTSFGPHYSDVTGKVTDGDAQCLYINAQCSLVTGIYFRRKISGNDMHYKYGYMPFADFKSKNVGDYYQSGDSNSDYPNYYITLEILIYQWLNNYGRGAQETPTSTAVRLSGATQLYQLYTGTTPPTPPVPPTPRRKMPLWMMLRPVNA